MGAKRRDTRGARVGTTMGAKVGAKGKDRAGAKSETRGEVIRGARLELRGKPREVELIGKTRGRRKGRRGS